MSTKTVTIPAPEVPYPGGRTQADFMRSAAANLERSKTREVGGSNVRATVVQLLRDVATALDTPAPTTPALEQYAVVNGWLVELANKHTYGAGPGSGTGCEPGCGMAPIAKVEALLAPISPAERLALTVAIAQVHRGEAPPANVATVCVMALARITGDVA